MVLRHPTGKGSPPYLVPQLTSEHPSFSVSLVQRVHLDIQVGEHAIDYANVAQKEKLSELQLRVRQLLDQVEQITKEQNYQRVRAKGSRK